MRHKQDGFKVAAEDLCHGNVGGIDSIFSYGQFMPEMRSHNALETQARYRPAIVGILAASYG
jgi:hypothetical protein